MRNFTIFIAVSLLGALVGCAPKALSPVEPPPASEPLDRVLIDAEEAVAWGEEHILPAIDRGLEDPIPAIKALMEELSSMSWSGKIAISMDTDPQIPDALAATLWSKEKGKPNIFLNVESLREIEPILPTDQFQDLVLAVLCHEMIHLESRAPTGEDPKGSSPEGRKMVLDQEAVVWARTVVEVVRPLQEANRYVSPQAVKTEQAFASCGDDSDGPTWREWVRANCVE